MPSNLPPLGSLKIFDSSSIASATQVIGIGFELNNEVIILDPLEILRRPRRIATLGNDSLTGTTGNDILYGEDGNDTLNGGGGADRLYGGSGNDLLSGGIGNDILSGGTGRDSLYGDDGDDILNGDDGDDFLNGGLNNDLLYGGSGVDSLYGEGGNDTLYGEDNNDYLDGGNENDLLLGGEGNDILIGGSGNDTLRGGFDSDVLTGGIGNDTFVFQYGSSSRPGDSRVTPVIVPDRITDFEIGIDRISLVKADGSPNFPSTLTRVANNNTFATLNGLVASFFSLGQPLAGFNNTNKAVLVTSTNLAIAGTYIVANDSNPGFQANNDLVINITGYQGLLPPFGNISPSLFFSSPPLPPLRVGTPGNDTLIGTTSDDTIYGEAGNDNISGGLGNDLLYGGIGNDILNGDAGVDVLNGGLGNDQLIGGDSLDVLNGDAGNDTLKGDAGNDILNGGAGNDTLEGGTDSDLMYGEDGDDLIDGDAVLNSPPGNGNDTLLGGSGNDTLIGGAGNDILTGGDNGDTLTGGAGSDTFVFQFGQSSGALDLRLSHSAFANPDHIKDFEVGTDKISLVPNFFLTGFSPVNLFYSILDGGLSEQLSFVPPNTAQWFEVGGTSDAYLVINDGVDGFNVNNDLVVKITLASGSQPVNANTLPSQVFV